MKFFSNKERTLGVLTSGILMSIVATPLFARDLTYKVGLGYRQATTVQVDKATNAERRIQLNGLDLSLGVGPDLHLGLYFGAEPNLDFAALGPKVRYDMQRLIDRDNAVWTYLNIFLEGAFMAKFGRESKAGVTIHAPYLGFEIMPFANNGFAILTSAGAVFDFVAKNRVGFTQGMFGDVGVKYYF